MSIAVTPVIQLIRQIIGSPEVMRERTDQKVIAATEAVLRMIERRAGRDADVIKLMAQVRSVLHK